MIFHLLHDYLTVDLNFKVYIFSYVPRSIFLNLIPKALEARLLLVFYQIKKILALVQNEELMTKK